MVLFALLLALLLDQFKPLSMNTQLNAWVNRWFDAVVHRVHGGQAYQHILVWAVAVLMPALFAWWVFRGLAHLSGFLAFMFLVASLWAGLGVRSFGRHVSDIRAALERGDDRLAQSQLSDWTGRDATGADGRQEVMTRVLAHAAETAHQQVLGAMLAFMCLAALGFGPMGVVLYRLSAWYVAYTRAQSPDETHGWALRTWTWADAVPARLTAVAFAVVGHFEEAMSALRTVPSSHLVLAVLEASLKVRLRSRDLADDLDAPTFQPVQLAHLGAMMGLVWRAAALWLLLLLLLTLAGWLG